MLLNLKQFRDKSKVSLQAMKVYMGWGRTPTIHNLGTRWSPDRVIPGESAPFPVYQKNKKFGGHQNKSERFGENEKSLFPAKNRKMSRLSSSP